jgi:hypothetical protein
MPTIFFINRGDRVDGPIHSSELRAMVESGQLRRDDRIGTSAAGPWTRAERAKGLFPNANTAPAAPAPPPSGSVSTDGSDYSAHPMDVATPPPVPPAVPPSAAGSSGPAEPLSKSLTEFARTSLERRLSWPATPSGSLRGRATNLHVAGLAIWLLGGVILLSGILLDPSFENPALSSMERQVLHSNGMTSRVNNLGLMSDRQTLILSGTMVCSVGVLTIVAGEVLKRLRPSPTIS